MKSDWLADWDAGELSRDDAKRTTGTGKIHHWPEQDDIDDNYLPSSYCTPFIISFSDPYGLASPNNTPFTNIFFTPKLVIFPQLLPPPAGLEPTGHTSRTRNGALKISDNIIYTEQNEIQNNTSDKLFAEIRGMLLLLRYVDAVPNLYYLYYW